MNGKFNFQPHLKGDTFSIRPLRANDFDELYQCASDKKIWEGHPSKDRHEKSVFQRWFDKAIASNATIVITDNTNDDEIIGTSRYYFYEDDDDISIGFTFIVRKHWGGNTNFKVKQLMMSYAYQFFDVVWFHIAPINIRSQKATEKLGATFSHEVISNITGKPEPWYCYRFDKKQFNKLIGPAQYKSL